MLVAATAEKLASTKDNKKGVNLVDYSVSKKDELKGKSWAALMVQMKAVQMADLREIPSVD